MKVSEKESNFLFLPPVKEQTGRPLWTVIIPTYNCAHYLKGTLKSVLAQDQGIENMEIIVVDDHSTKDDPKSVVDEIGQGRVQFIRQENNVGKVRNYETGLKASKGYFIHQLHGDDMVRPGFYKTISELFRNYPHAAAAFCRSIYINDADQWTGITGMLQEHDGVVLDMVDKIYVEQQIQTPSMVVKREVYEDIGTFDRRLNCIEDWEMWIRIANNYPIATTNLVLAMYRSHEQNTSQISFEDGSFVKEQQLICEIVDDYINPEIRRKNHQLRKQRQAKGVLNYKNLNLKLSKKQKLKFAKYILMRDFSLKTIYRLLT